MALLNVYRAKASMMLKYWLCSKSIWLFCVGIYFHCWENAEVCMSSMLFFCQMIAALAT